ncbi:tyrosine-type recombinase/integrase [Siminovitchia sp. 179-K 8D1 HS]|uniref:tyrosine-type recombinase/integrase n=1 Tax=Siminovitchia sp. 179-K 8D1 HS TaxID=3142385 RepID=UPI0039A1049B
MKIVEAIKEFEFEQQVNGLSKKYIALCQHRLNSWKTYMIDELFIDEVDLVTERHIKLFIRYRQNLGREKNITINNRLATLKVFFKFLIEMEVISKEKNPMANIKNLKEGRTVISTFTDDEVKRIIDSTGSQTYSNIRDKTILIFLFETGVRVSELVGIRNSDVFLDRIFIRGKGSHERYVYISKKMRRQMKRYERAKKLRFEHLPSSMVDDYYFLNQEADGMSRSNVNKILRRAGTKAKVREEIRCSPHDCRHYFAQKQIKQGIDVYSLSRLLGHSSIDITTQYLRGLQMDDIIDIGRRTSPLRDIPIKLI